VEVRGPESIQFPLLPHGDRPRFDPAVHDRYEERLIRLRADGLTTAIRKVKEGQTARRTRPPRSKILHNKDNKGVAERVRDDELLTIGEVADIVRVPVATLRYWRHLGTGPRSFRIGRGVRYWHHEVTTWLHSQSDGPTAA
jgi:predicted DNA-binding transcriptional regulator AlpA